MSVRASLKWVLECGWGNVGSYAYVDGVRHGTLCVCGGWCPAGNAAERDAANKM